MVWRKTHWDKAEAFKLWGIAAEFRLFCHSTWGFDVDLMRKHVELILGELGFSSRKMRWTKLAMSSHVEKWRFEAEKFAFDGTNAFFEPGLDQATWDSRSRAPPWCVRCDRAPSCYPRRDWDGSRGRVEKETMLLYEVIWLLYSFL